MVSKTHSELFQQAVKKASADLQERGASRVTKDQIVEEIALFITYSSTYRADEAELMRYWSTLEQNPQAPLHNPDMLEGMAQYLGHVNFDAWKVAQQVKAPIQRTNRTAILLVLLAAGVVMLLGILAFFFLGNAS